MVARIVCGKNIKGLVLYNENKVSENKAAFIHASKFGLEKSELTIDEKVRRFQKLHALNKRVKTNAVHISLNFHYEDKLDKDKLTRIANAYMDKIGFRDQPYLVYEHKDAAHPHIHIVTTNLDKEGKRINLHNIGKMKSEPARKELEAEFNLQKAEGRSIQENFAKEIEPAIYGKSETKRTITHIVREVSRTYRFVSLPELNAALRHYNIIADRGFEGTAMFNQGGLAYSIIGEDGRKIGVPIKASRLSGKPTLKFLEQQFKLNKLLRKKAIPDFRNRVAAILDSRPQTLEKFSKLLRHAKIDLVIRENKDGKVYGLTYVDHQSRCVVNGSDLGKGFTANGVLAALDSPTKKRRGKQRTFLPANSLAQQSNASQFKPQLPEWILQLTQSEQLPGNAPEIGNRKRRRKKKKGRSI